MFCGKCEVFPTHAFAPHIHTCTSLKKNNRVEGKKTDFVFSKLFCSRHNDALISTEKILNRDWSKICVTCFLQVCIFLPKKDHGLLPVFENLEQNNNLDHSKTSRLFLSRHKNNWKKTPRLSIQCTYTIIIPICSLKFNFGVNKKFFSKQFFLSHHQRTTPTFILKTVGLLFDEKNPAFRRKYFYPAN